MSAETVAPLWYRTLAWRWRRRRAAAQLRRADLAVRRFPSAANRNYRNLAADICRRTDLNRPYRNEALR
jgi:hypothetical protein